MANVSNSNWKPDVTVAAICERNGKFLLVEEISKSTGNIVFNQPAGHIEDNETILQAVAREALEETCCVFTPEALLGLYRLRINTNQTYLRYAFTGSVSEPNKQLIMDPDITTTHWLTYQEIQTHSQLRSPIVLQCIEDYLSGQRFPLEVINEL